MQDRNLNINVQGTITGRFSVTKPNLSNTPKSVFTKIPEETLNRSRFHQTMAVEIAFAIECPTCKAPAGYYCNSKQGNKSYKYHETRFSAYMKKSKHHPSVSRGTKREELKGH